MFGTIVLHKSDRSFGFIRQAERPADIFFHASEFNGDPGLLEAGAAVEFSLGERKGKNSCPRHPAPGIGGER